MDYKEAIEILKDFDSQVSAKADGAYQSTIGKMACDIAISAMQELQELKKIGTMEEVREAVEKQKEERPIALLGTFGGEEHECRECGNTVEYMDEYCKWCGKKLDWSEEDEQ